MAQFLGFSKTVIRNLFSKPVTTAYPAAPKVYPERTRGHVEIHIEDCILCGMCMRSCPPGAIEVKRNENIWSINRFDCIQCGYCVEKCPKKCLSIVPGYATPDSRKTVETVTKPVVEEKKPVEPVAKPAAEEKKPVEPAAKPVAEEKKPVDA